MTQAERILSKFPTMAALARELGHTHTSTVNAWKRSGFIHQRHHNAIMEAARQMGVELMPADFSVIEDSA